MIQSYREIGEYRGFLREYVLQILRGRYRGSILGYGWTLLNPLLTCLTFGFVFAYLNRASLSDFVTYFLAGNLAWTYFNSTAVLATGAITGNSNYVNKMYVPNGIFPLGAVLVSLVDLLAGLPMYILFLLIFAPERIQVTSIFIPVSIVIFTVFCTGIAFLFASIGVFFRDFPFLWNSLSFTFFFCTPILYKAEQMPEPVRQYFALNIVYPFIRLFQDPLYYGRLPDSQTITLSMLYAFIMLVLGISVFVRSQRQFYMYV